PLRLELGEGRPALLEVLVGARPVNLVEVDRLDAEPREARVDLPADGVALEVAHDLPAAAVHARCLGEHVRSRLDALERAPHDLPGVRGPVSGGGVDPVDAELQRAVDRRDRLVVVLSAPAELPAGAADRPGPEADTRDLHAGGTELRGRQCGLSHAREPSSRA